MKKIIGIVQARMSSQRLPGKVMMKVMGRSLLSYMIERLIPSETVDQFIVATSSDPSDDVIVDWCKKTGVVSYRGNLTDVLDRFYQCASGTDPIPDIIVRLTADCPLHHYRVVDYVVNLYQESGADFCTNSFSPNTEGGFDVEVFSYAVLKQAWTIRKEDIDKEHVTPLMRRDSKLKKVLQRYSKGFKQKLSVDTEQEFQLIRHILETLYPRCSLFTIDDVTHLLETRPRFKETIGPSR